LHPASRDKVGLAILVGVPESSTNPCSSPKNASTRPLLLRTVLGRKPPNAALGASEPTSNGRPRGSPQIRLRTPQTTDLPSRAETIEQAAAWVTRTARRRGCRFPLARFRKPQLLAKLLRYPPKASSLQQQATTGQSSSRNKKKRVTFRQSSPRHGSMRVRMLGITSDGKADLSPAFGPYPDRRARLGRKTNSGFRARPSAALSSSGIKYLLLRPPNFGPELFSLTIRFLEEGPRRGAETQRLRNFRTGQVLAWGNLSKKIGKKKLA